jgi:hypothetical protein
VHFSATSSATPSCPGAPATATLDQDAAPGGSVYFNPAVGAGIPANGFITIKRVAQATDPLDLNLASPTGKIAWLNVLRGLMLGTTKNEKRFSGRQRSPSTRPRAPRSTSDDESSHGGDPPLPALDINDRILFVQRGRKVLRLAGISITSDGGLVSEDVGVLGEHLTAARVRSMCYLKSPVPRVVLAFDDGTGAVMTLVGKASGSLASPSRPARRHLQRRGAGGRRGLGTVGGHGERRHAAGADVGVGHRGQAHPAPERVPARADARHLRHGKPAAPGDGRVGLDDLS